MSWAAIGGLVLALIKLAGSYLGFKKAEAEKDKLKSEEKNAENKIIKEQERVAVTSPRTAAAIDKWLRERGF